MAAGTASRTSRSTASNGNTATTPQSNETVTPANVEPIDESTLSVRERYQRRIEEMKQQSTSGRDRLGEIAVRRAKYMTELETLDSELPSLSNADKKKNLKEAAKILTKLDKLDALEKMTPDDLKQRRDKAKADREQNRRVAEMVALSEEDRNAALAEMPEEEQTRFTKLIALRMNRKPRATKTAPTEEAAPVN